MKIKVFIIFLIVFQMINQGYAQRGKDGPRTVSASNVVYNEYTTLTVNATAGNSIIQVAASGLNVNNRFGYALAPGDLIFIIQMQGASLDGGSWWPNWGSVNNYSTSGNNEFAEVVSVPNTTSIQLSCPLSKSYTSAGRVQVVRVPRLTALAINSGGSLTCDAWNGSMGGVLVLEVNGTTTINSGGLIHVDAKGFRGGVNSDMNSATGVTLFASTDNNNGAEKGEGIGGYQADYDLIDGRYCKNAAANGGGGGNAHNGGGGGGANGSRIYFYNGKGNPDTSNASWIAAWDLESVNFHKNQSDGGGRGGYTFSYSDMDATLVGPGDGSWGGDNRRNEGGQGGRPLDYNFGRLFLGGGGGAGDQGPNTNWGGNGGRGGGLIYVLSYGNINGNGLFTSNGDPGIDAQGAPPWNGHGGIDGSGGGGAGGTIVLNTTAIVSNSLTMTANGGKGGSQIKSKSLLVTVNGEAEGPGGGGGGGNVFISAGNPTRVADGGINGICTALEPGDNGLSEFPPNGATSGGKGDNTSGVLNCSLLTWNDTICQGDSAFLIAITSGTVPAGTTINWYDSEVAGNLVGSGDTLWLNNVTTTVHYYAGFCPGTYRVDAMVYVYPDNSTAGPDIFLCNSTSDTLHASGGISYNWSPAGLLDNPLSPDPVATVAGTTIFSVTILNSYGCVSTDSATLYVDIANAAINNDTTICIGNPVLLSASGGAEFNWSTGDSVASFTITPLSTQLYTVTVSTGTCSDTASVMVTVNPLPLVFLGNDTLICQGNSVLLDASNSGSTYLWMDSSTGQTLNVIASGNYTVTVTSPAGCTGSDGIIIGVNDWADATITPVAALCANDGAINLTAADTGGIWSGNGIIDQNSGIFNPTVSGAGQHNITYTISGLCGDIDQQIIEVYSIASLSFSSQEESCIGSQDASIDLTISSGTPPFLISWSNGLSTEDISNLIPGTYTVLVTDSNLCSVSSSELINASAIDCYLPHVFVPNVFSPNGDLINDVFYVRGAGLISMEFIIYDRWGEKVFQSTSLTDGWDGTFRGKNCDTGVYFYNLKAEFDNDEIFKTKGNVTLVR